MARREGGLHWSIVRALGWSLHQAIQPSGIRSGNVTARQRGCRPRLLSTESGYGYGHIRICPYPEHQAFHTDPPCRIDHFRRWWRVRANSFLCLCFLIFFLRFLMTLPNRSPPSRTNRKIFIGIVKDCTIPSGFQPLYRKTCRQRIFGPGFFGRFDPWQWRHVHEHRSGKSRCVVRREGNERDYPARHPSSDAFIHRLDRVFNPAGDMSSYTGMSSPYGTVVVVVEVVVLIVVVVVVVVPTMTLALAVSPFSILACKISIPSASPAW